MAPPQRVSAVVTATPGQGEGHQRASIGARPNHRQDLHHAESVSGQERHRQDHRATQVMATAKGSCTREGARSPPRRRTGPVKEDEDRAGRHAQHRQRDGKERKVVPGQHREQPASSVSSSSVAKVVQQSPAKSIALFYAPATHASPNGWWPGDKAADRIARWTIHIASRRSGPGRRSTRQSRTRPTDGCFPPCRP